MIYLRGSRIYTILLQWIAGFLYKIYKYTIWRRTRLLKGTIISQFLKGRVDKLQKMNISVEFASPFFHSFHSTRVAFWNLSKTHTMRTVRTCSAAKKFYYNKRRLNFHGLKIAFLFCSHLLSARYFLISVVLSRLRNSVRVIYSRLHWLLAINLFRVHRLCVCFVGNTAKWNGFAFY